MPHDSVRGRAVTTAPVAPLRTPSGGGAREVRCITGPADRGSVAFHTRMVFSLEPGDHEEDVPVHADDDGPGADRVSFVRPLP